MELGQKSSNPSSFMICNGELLFLAETTSSGRQLWSSKKREVTGIEEAYEGEALTLYPNPVSDFIYVNSGNKYFKPLRIANMSGKLVPFQHDRIGRIHVGNLTPGLYILIAEVEKKVVVRKFLKR
nr:T9SS type A sorting domain-containing protein [Pontibacter ummariensis]